MIDPERTPHTVDIATTVKSRDGKVVFEHNDQRSSSDLQGANGAYVHTIALPVSDLAQGNYVLTVRHDRVSGRLPADRSRSTSPPC